MRTQKQWIKHLDFTVLDILVTALAFLAACALRPGPLRPLLRDPVYQISLVVLIAAAAFLGFAVPVHRDILRRSFLKECSESAKFVLVQAVAVSFFNYVGKISNRFSRFVFVMYILCAFLFLVTGRCIHRRTLNSRLSDSKRLHRLILIADEGTLCEKTAYYRQNGSKQFQVTAAAVLTGNVAEGDREKLGDGVTLLEGHEALYGFLQNEVVDEILIADSRCMQDQELLQKLMSAGVTIYIGLDDAYDILPNVHIEDVAEKLVIASTAVPFSPEQLIIKRAVDILLSLAGLLVTGIVLIIFGPVIFIQSPGPVFYTQTRVGLNGRRFRMYKFRSMYPDADSRKKELMDRNKMDGFMFKMDDDPRIIPVGRFMRKHSLDELPQFYNVLKGDMSVVGTRPPTIDEWEKYSLEHKARLSMKPGITGLWQVSGRNEIVNFDEVVALDMKYIRGWDLQKDLAIIMRTIMVVLQGKGAS